MIVTPEVRLIAHTTIPSDLVWADTKNEDGTRTAEFVGATDALMESDEAARDMDTLAEFAGRSCYQSFGKPNPATAANIDYLANIIRQQHTSVLEHASASFYITGVSRAFLAEITRHRHLSFSVQSQRFVNESDADYVVPPAVRGIDIEEILLDVDAFTKEAYEALADTLTDRGVPRKQAREAARAVLPNMTEVRMVVTGNARAWRDVLSRRLDPAADAEIREVSALILKELKKVAPNSFQDL